jgi:hypothetical protein
MAVVTRAFRLVVERHAPQINEALASLITETPPRTLPGFGGSPPPQREGKTRKNKRYVHPLDYLLAQDLIPYGEYIAGVRFHSDWELSGITGSQTTAWSRLTDAVHKGNSSKRRVACKRVKRQPMAYQEIAPYQVDSREVLRKASQRMSQIGFKLLVCVCGRGMTLSDVANMIGADRQSIFRAFRAALAEACDFYNETIDCRDKD